MYEIVGKIVVWGIVWEIVGLLLYAAYSAVQVSQETRRPWTLVCYDATGFEGDILGYHFACWAHHYEYLRAGFVAPILVWPAFVTGWQRRRREAREFEALKRTLDAAGRNT